MSIRNMLSIILVMLSLSCIAQSEKYDVHKTFRKSEYIEDLQLLADSVKAIHPQPLEFISEKDFDALVAGKKASITDSTTIGEFLWMCNSVTAAIGCGHSTMMIEHKLNLSLSIFFPMEIVYIEDKLYVINPKSNKSLIKPGTEILSINGIDASFLKQDIRSHIPTDAYSKSMRDALINNYFSAYCAYHLGFPLKYIITVKEHNIVREITLEQSEKKTISTGHLFDCKDNLCFDIDSAKDVAVITIRSFVYYNDDFHKFSAFVDECFEQIKNNNIKNVIIDLRNNMGGDPFCASYLMQHLSSKPFRYYVEGSTKWYKDLEKMISPDEDMHIGKTYILINGNCFSTTGHFCALIKEHTPTIFIGQETGGTYTCNANNKNLTLKNTGLVATIATETYQVDVSGFSKKQGIIPDYITKPDLNDILKNRDIELEKAYELINK